MSRPYWEKPFFKIFTSYWQNQASFPPHFHKSLEITFCFSGKQDIIIDGNQYTLNSGDAAVILPNIVHEYITNDNYKLSTETISVICTTNLIENIFPEILEFSLEAPVTDGICFSDICNLAFRNMIDPDDEAQLTGWLIIVFSEIKKHLSFTKSTPVKSVDFLPLFLSFIDNNYQQNLTIEHLSKKFGYSASYIAHLFCDRLKIPFRTYLGNLRSEQAAKLITTTEKSLTEIAYECGFNSLNTFCRCFKKCYSETPSAYKKKILNL